MKTIQLLIFIMFITTSVYAQTASDYFPSQTGYKWYFESVPLDSVNNPVNSQKFYSIDSFTVVAPFNGKNANIVLTKTGALNTINFQPYLDSLFYSFETTNGFEYFDPVTFAGLLGNIDTTLGIDFFSFFNSLKGWHSYYRFASVIDDEYQIFQKDTAITVNSISATIRFELIGKRLADETLNTAIGNFDCKKILLEVRVSYLFLNIFPVKMFGVENTIWLAPGNWKVKSYIPTTNVDLSILGVPAFNVPGLESNITTPITNVENEYEFVNDFELHQNYPNPFNPSTKIKFSISKQTYLKINLYNMLGELVKTIADGIYNSGNHEVTFNAGDLTSGVYLYRMESNEHINSKKMLILK